MTSIVDIKDKALLEKYFDLTFNNFQTGCQKLITISENKMYVEVIKLSKKLNNKNIHLNWSLNIEKKPRKIQMIYSQLTLVLKAQSLRTREYYYVCYVYHELSHDLKYSHNQSI